MESRQKLHSSAMMKDMLKKMVDEQKVPGILRAEQKGFRHINHLWAFYDEVLEH